MSAQEEKGSGSPGKEIDLELLAFIERYVNNPIKWEIVALFGKNPYTRDTASGIAQRLGRSPKIILPELFDLSLLGILEHKEMNGQAIFQLRAKKELWNMLFKFVNRFGQQLDTRW